MDSEYDIVPYRAEFKSQVIDLQRQLWSPNLDLNRAYFEWKYERNPYVPEPLVYLALHRSAVTGMRGFFGMQWEAGSPAQTLTGLYADDLVIARGHRNRGLIPRLMRAAFEDLARRGYEYLFSLSAGPVTYLSSLATGWRSAGSGRPMSCGAWPWNLITNRKLPHGVARRLRRALPSPMDRAFSRLSGAYPFEVAQRSGVSFAFEPPAEAMSALLKRIGTDGRIRHVRDRTYLKWRFQNPLSRYGFLLSDDSDGLDGYLVLQEYTSAFADPARLNVVDWEATSMPVLERLLDTACQLSGHRKQLFTWTATLSQDKLALLVQRGFREETEEGVGEQKNSVLVRALATDRPAMNWLLAGKALTDLAEWDVRMLYSMHG